MRRLIDFFLVSLLLTIFSGCNREPQKDHAAMTEESAPPLATLVDAANPKTASQLASGFWDVEGNAWRWTKRQFSVNLRPPLDSASKGAKLVLTFSVPDPVIRKLTKVTLTASVAGVALAPETYAKTGQYVYSRDVPAAALAGSIVKVDFALDKAMPPSPADARELGVVVNSVGLEPK
jgi:hypothetical protein